MRWNRQTADITLGVSISSSMCSLCLHQHIMIGCHAVSYPTSQTQSKHCTHTLVVTHQPCSGDMEYKCSYIQSGSFEDLAIRQQTCSQSMFS